MSLPALPRPQDRFAAALLALLSVACLVGILGSSLALLAGIGLGLWLGNPVKAQTQKASGLVLKTAVVGLGFGLPLNVVLATARDSLALTIATIALALLAGWWLAKWLKVESVLGQLLAAGTAICGGSAIAAVAPVLRAKSETIAVAVAVVFLLNALGLVIFPPLGHWLGLTQAEFGLWAALAIHDTSSVVGAAANYGNEALAVATTAKLARAIWIVPLVLLFGIVNRSRDQQNAFPLFISFFLLASLIRTLVPALADIAPHITSFARDLFALSLLWIGAGITRTTLRNLSMRPLILAVTLWLILATGSLLAIEAMHP
ncbi:putative sulfate exporter family transporter [Permianibacter sp. IMCC34836]|uniref:YeiH family protein n=1 Tax=Permianibacter fluminis TaxID=2738515 RepID=UPI00155512F6|nr:putative sulfate exporter family transporter [Permianibacter fluminis]NQD37115.1 putative sulfate exporter family transporter [Permianibacter fluminis]